MSKVVRSRLILLIGLAVVASSWFSIKPSCEHRYKNLLERHKVEQESVSSEEWVWSKDDESLTALVVLFIGIPAFIFVTVGVIVITRIPHKPLPTGLFLGLAWILLGSALHLLIWIS